MQSGRFCKLAVRATVVVAVLLVCLVTFFIVEQRRTRAELGSVLSDLIGERVRRYPPELGPERGIQIVVMREAEPGKDWWAEQSEHEPTWKTRWRVLLHQRWQFPQSSLVTRGSFILSNAVPTDIRAELHLPKGVDWAVLSHSQFEHMAFIENGVPNNREYFVVSQVGLNFNKTEGILYIEHYCGGLCGGGS